LVLRSIAYRDKKVVGDIRFSCAAVRSRMRCRRSQVRGLAPIVLVSGQDSAVLGAVGIFDFYSKQALARSHLKPRPRGRCVP
jgi:hypothetical protein